MSARASIPTYGLVTLFIIMSLVFVMPVTPVEADSTMDKLSDIQDKLKSKLKDMTKTRKKEKSLKSEIGQIEHTIESKQQEINTYNRRISDTESKLNSLSSEIEEMNRNIHNRKHYLKERIIAIYKRQYGGEAFTLVSAKDQQDLIRKSNYLSLMTHYDKTVLDEYSTHVEMINKKKDELKSLQDSLLSEKNSILKKKKALQSDRSNKDKLLARVAAKKKEQERKIRELNASSKKLQRLMKDLKAKTIPQALLGAGFSSLKGSLPWPVEVLSQGKGNSDPDRGVDLASIKKGIEIMTGPESQVMSVAGGRVVYSGDFTGYGKVLIIDHGSRYHTLYGNLSEISSKTGELIAKGMAIGKPAQAKKSGNPTLYFEIRHKGQPVNPIPWLKKR